MHGQLTIGRSMRASVRFARSRMRSAGCAPVVPSRNSSWRAPTASAPARLPWRAEAGVRAINLGVLHLEPSRPSRLRGGGLRRDAGFQQPNTCTRNGPGGRDLPSACARNGQPTSAYTRRLHSEMLHDGSTPTTVCGRSLSRTPARRCSGRRRTGPARGAGISTASDPRHRLCRRNHVRESA